MSDNELVAVVVGVAAAVVVTYLAAVALCVRWLFATDRCPHCGKLLYEPCTPADPREE